MKMVDFRKGVIPYYLAIEFLSPHTVLQKKQAIQRFVDFMLEHEASEIRPELILKYRSELKKGYKPSTINQYLKILKTLFSWMLENGYWQGGNPVKDSFLIREKPQEYTCVLTHEDLMRIEAATPDMRVGRNLEAFYRRKAEVLLLVTSAVRCNELIHIRPCDMNWVDDTIRIVEAKGGKPRTVLFHPIAQRAVEDYMDNVRHPNATDDDPLFVMFDEDDKQKFHPMPKRTVEHDIKAYIKQTTGRNDIFPHALRHTSARYMVSSGMPLPEIQALLGHSSVKMTEHYAKLLSPDTTPIRSADGVFDKIYKGNPVL